MAERRGIRGRIVLLVGLGALAPLAVLAVTAGSRISALESQLHEERMRLARSLASHVGTALEKELAALSGIASDARFEMGGPGTSDRLLLSGVLARTGLLASAFVVRDASMVVEPAGPPPACAAGRVEAVRAPRLEAAGGQLCLLAPVDASVGHIVVGGVIATDRPAWAALLQPPGKGASVRLVRAEGSGALATADDAALIPLPLADWQLAVVEPAAGAAAFARLRARSALAFALIVPVVLVFAWGAARSLTRPLAALGDAADRIAVGHIEEPLPDLGSDEVGRLGRSMEAMRQALERALEAAARANTRLEQRVEERTRELERLNAELKRRERARGELLRKVISAQEDERKRIARELHDESCQTLSILAIQLDELRARLPDPTAAEAAAAARALAVRTLDEVHRLIFDLRPALLDDLGLPAALRWLAGRHLEPAGVAVRFENSPLEARLPPEAETAVFRAAQEVLTNVARHAEASSVLVQIGQQGEDLVIEIEDDGRGFDLHSAVELAPTGRGLGLLGIRERMELLGGSAEVESAPGEGTRVVLKAPLPKGTTWLASAS